MTNRPNLPSFNAHDVDVRRRATRGGKNRPLRVRVQMINFRVVEECYRAVSRDVHTSPQTIESIERERENAAPKKLRVGVLGRAHTSSKPLENTVNTVQNFKNCSEN